MPHGEMGLAGPGIYAGIALVGVALVASILMTINALRRPRYHFGKLGPWGYVGFSMLYVIMLLGLLFIRVSGLGANIAGRLFLAFVLFTLLMIIVTIMYLLGVVFPGTKDRERRANYEAEHGIEPDQKADSSARRSDKTKIEDAPRAPIGGRGDGEYFDE